ncbi:hypothetical protein DI272_11970 [Streptomyces sp. Act143]|nr:hypothetical protein DI272_11970 [Streptomyces sp. Act143]
MPSAAATGAASALLADARDPAVGVGLWAVRASAAPEAEAEAVAEAAGEVSRDGAVFDGDGAPPCPLCSFAAGNTTSEHE